MLWDLDGTLVDTEPAWMAAEERLVAEFDGTWSRAQSLALVGSGLPQAAVVLQGAGVRMPVPEIVDRLTDEVIGAVVAAPPWRPGALELLGALRAEGMRTALVTMSVRRMAEAIAAAVPFAAFDVLVTGDEVARPKPDPEPYLLAARLLGVDPAACVALEDSRPGLASAVAAGTCAIGVPHLVALPAGDAWTIWPTLAGRTGDDLEAVAASAAGAAAATVVR